MGLASRMQTTGSILFASIVASTSVAYAAALILDCVAGRRLIRGRARERCRRRLSALLLSIGRVSIKSESAAVSQIDTDGFGKGRGKAGMKYKHKACFKGLRRDRVVGDRDSIISLADNVSLLAPSRLRPSYFIVVLHSAGACTSTYTNQFHLCLNQLLQKGFRFDYFARCMCARKEFERWMPLCRLVGREVAEACHTAWDARRDSDGSGRRGQPATRGYFFSPDGVICQPVSRPILAGLPIKLALFMTLSLF